MKIDSIVHNAVLGVEQGLDQARLASSQLAVGAPKQEKEVQNAEGESNRVEKTADADLGKIIDEKA